MDNLINNISLQFGFKGLSYIRCLVPVEFALTLWQSYALIISSVTLSSARSREILVG